MPRTLVAKSALWLLAGSALGFVGCNPVGTPPVKVEPTPPPAGVTAIAVVASVDAGALAYRTAPCLDCVRSVKQTMQTQVRVAQPGWDGGATVFTEAGPDGWNPPSLLGGAASSAPFFVFDSSDGGLFLTVLADGVASSTLLPRPRPQAAGLHGSTRRGGVATGAGAAAGAASATAWIVTGSEDAGVGLELVHVALDGGLLRSVALPDDALDAVVTVANDAPAAAWSSDRADAGALPISVRLAGTAPASDVARGLPLSLWTDGKSFRLLFRGPDELLGVTDGAGSVGGPASPEGSCLATAFGPDGTAYALVASGPKATLYAQLGDKPFSSRELTQAATPVSGNKRCALAVTATQLHLAWNEGNAAADRYAALPTVVHHEVLELPSLTTLHRGKHDTVKNSINNVR